MKESLYLFLEEGIREWNKAFADEEVTVQIQKKARHYYEVFKVNVEEGVREINDKKLLFTSKIKGAQCEFEFFFNPVTESELYQEFMKSNFAFGEQMPLKLTLDSKAEIGLFFRDYIWSLSPGR